VVYLVSAEVQQAFGAEMQHTKMRLPDRHRCLAISERASFTIAAHLYKRSTAIKHYYTVSTTPAINQSIDQSKHIYIVPYLAGESEHIVAENTGRVFTVTL